MGFWEMYPYADTSQLNIDWVLHVVKDMEKTMHDLNTRIADVVNPIIDAQRSFIQSYYNQLLTDFNRISNNMDARVKQMERRVNKQLYDNVQQMQKLNRDVINNLRESEAKNELTVTRYMQEVQRLVTFYNSTFNSLAVQIDKNNSAKLREYERKFESMIRDNKIAMNKLQDEVENELTQMQLTLDTTVAKLHQQMADVVNNVSAITADNLRRIQIIRESIMDEISMLADQQTQYYKNITVLFNDVNNMLNIKIDGKVDKQVFDAEIERLVDMINNIQMDMTIVINPTTGMLSTVQQALDDLYDNNRPWALTAEEYDALGLRAYEYDDIADNGMTAYNYDYLARWFLIYKFAMVKECKDYTDTQVSAVRNDLTTITDSIIKTADDRWAYIQKCCADVNKNISELMFMYSPFTGQYTPIKYILQQMFEHLYGAETLTAAEYDDLQLTAVDYDDKQITAYNYDWSGKTILGGA